MALAKAWEHGSAKHQYAHGSEAGRIATQYGEWIEGLGDWSWYVTRTFAPAHLTKGFSQAGQETCGRMLSDLLTRSDAKRFVCVFERQTRGDYHLHALLAGCKSINGAQESARDETKFGFAKWRIFNGSGAGGYLAKYLAADRGELYVGLHGPYTALGNKVKELRV